MKFEHVEVHNIEGAIRGMRNSMDSWDKSDSKYVNTMTGPVFIVGEEDMKLACKLIRLGTEHRKFLRQIFISMDITAPRYWWQEFDTYRIGVDKNSCSTMHKLKSYPITLDMFTIDELDDEDELSAWSAALVMLEKWRKKCNETGDIKYLRKMKQLMPEGFNQKRTVTMTYESALTALRQRDNHRLLEWAIDMCNCLLDLQCMKQFYQALLGK